MNIELARPQKVYRADKTIVFSCQYHVVWCPKYRRNLLVGSIAERLKELILNKQDEYEYEVHGLEVMPDHVHLLIGINPKIGPHKVIKKIKGFTSHELREEFPEIDRRLPTVWTRSYFISTVGSVSLEVVKRYIDNQKGK